MSLKPIGPLSTRSDLPIQDNEDDPAPMSKVELLKSLHPSTARLLAEAWGPDWTSDI